MEEEEEENEEEEEEEEAAAEKYVFYSILFISDYFSSRSLSRSFLSSFFLGRSFVRSCVCECASAVVVFHSLSHSSFLIHCVCKLCELKSVWLCARRRKYSQALDRMHTFIIRKKFEGCRVKSSTLPLASPSPDAYSTVSYWSFEYTIFSANTENGGACLQ